MLGAALHRTLLSNNYSNIITVPASELDLTNQAAVNTFFNKEQPEYVFLSASISGGILANQIYRADFLYNNLMIAANVINAAFTHKTLKLLNIGSSCIYPRLAEQPMKEEYLLSGHLEPAIEPTAISKIAAIKLCKFYNEQHSTNFITATPTNLYGRGDNFALGTAYVLPSLIRKFHLAQLLLSGNVDAIMSDFQIFDSSSSIFQNPESMEEVLRKSDISRDSVTIWGSGKAYREFLYIDDFADACIYLMENLNYVDIGEFINIGAEKDISINDLAELIKKTTGYNGKLKFDTDKPDGPPKKLLDSSKIRTHNWKQKIDLQQGIEKTYDWYCSKLAL